MNRIIVSVKRHSDPNDRDLELPTDVPTGELADRIARHFAWDRDIFGKPIAFRFLETLSNRYLDRQQSLMEADVWDGAEILLEPIGPQLRLVLQSDPTKEWPLDRPVLKIGRVVESMRTRPDIDLGPYEFGKTVSRIHAVMLQRGASWIVREEQDVPNHTFINDRQIRPGIEEGAEPGDRLRFGRVTLILRTSE